MSRYFFVDIRGPGHHERSELAGRVVEAIADCGKIVAVEADLRPRLAADLSEMLAVGAKEVLLFGKGMLATVVVGPEIASRGDLESLHDSTVEVVVRLVPSDGFVRAVIDPGQNSDLFEEISEALKRKNIDLQDI